MNSTTKKSSYSPRSWSDLMILLLLLGFSSLSVLYSLMGTSYSMSFCLTSGSYAMLNQNLRQFNKESLVYPLFPRVSTCSNFNCLFNSSNASFL